MVTTTQANSGFQVGNCVISVRTEDGPVLMFNFDNVSGMFEYWTSAEVCAEIAQHIRARTSGFVRESDFAVDSWPVERRLEPRTELTLRHTCSNPKLIMVLELDNQDDHDGVLAILDYAAKKE